MSKKAGANDSSRRSFIKKSAMGLTALGVSSNMPVFAGPFSWADFPAHLIPEDKKLSAAWIKSLYERGLPETFTAKANQLKHIGMPVSGIATGQLYLGGDGRLWFWHIFKTVYERELDHGQRMDAMTLGAHYQYPDKVFDRETRPVDQGAAIRLKFDGKTVIRPLNSEGFKDIAFRGEYPVGKVTYKDETLPVEIGLEAFSPFIPGDLENSALPATILTYKVKNTANQAVAVDLAGWLENAVCPYSNNNSMGVRRNTCIKAENRITIHSTAQAGVNDAHKALKEDVVFEDFESGSLKRWKATGAAFTKTATKEGTKGYHEKGMQGDYYVSSYNVLNLKGKPNNSTYGWGSITPADAFTGTLTSKTFTITHNYITCLIGGGYHPKETALNLIVGGKVVRSITAQNNWDLKEAFIDVRDFIGKKAKLQLVDNHQGMWGSISVDHIVFTDKEPAHNTLTDQHGYGSMAWSLKNPTKNTKVKTNLPTGTTAENLFKALGTPNEETITTPMGKGLVGAINESFVLEAGEEKEVTFVLTWFFPYLPQQEVEGGAITNLKGAKYLKKHYHNWFKSANQVADYVSANFKQLAGGTRLWNKTYYDSTLPYWLLDRSFIPIDALATNTTLWFDNGRIWAWEGVECCQGTCEHVWQYAQGAARIFPQFEKTLREVTDLGYSYNENGGLGHRDESAGGYGLHVAHDGHCGTIMRFYREHKMSADNRFLKANYAKIKKSVAFIINEDKDKDGLLEGGQSNTLDAQWFGPMGWISSLYLGALAAAKEMALEVADADFAQTCEELIVKGRKNIVDKLFNGEYFIHLHDREKYPNAISSNDGCHIDQVLGQSFAHQIGIKDRIVPEKETKKALESIWKYNFAPDAFQYQKDHKVLKGVRIYATEGEAATVMTTWPKSDGDTYAVPGMSERPAYSDRWQGPGAYFDEAMNGFEYQVAVHMIWEGMLEKGLATARVVHDRYNANKRNPYNEVECSDHYSRSMASYGVLLAVCGFDYHGPKGEITFNPQLDPDNFKAPFTVAEGWGTFKQTRKDGVQENQLCLQYGHVNLTKIHLQLPAQTSGGTAVLKLNGEKLLATATQQANGAYTWVLEENLKAGDVLTSVINY